MSQKRPSRLQKRDSNSKREVRTWKELGTRVKQTMWDNWSTWPVVESKCSVSRLDSWNLNAQFVLKIPRLLWMHSEALRFRFNGKRYGELEIPKMFEMNPYSIDVKLHFFNYKFWPTRPILTSERWVDWFLALWAESRALDLAFKVFYWRHVVKMKVSVIEESREPIWWAPDWNGFSCYQRPSSTATRYTLTYTVMYTPAYKNLQYQTL